MFRRAGCLSNLLCNQGIEQKLRCLEVKQGIDQSCDWNLHAEHDAQHWQRIGATLRLQAYLRGFIGETYLYGHFYCRHRQTADNDGTISRAEMGPNTLMLGQFADADTYRRRRRPLTQTGKLSPAPSCENSLKCYVCLCFIGLPMPASGEFKTGAPLTERTACTVCRPGSPPPPPAPGSRPALTA